MATSERGEHAEFLVLYNKVQPLLRGYLLAWLRNYDRAEDILQTTSLAMWEGFGRFDKSSSFEGWALGIARNQALKEFRRTKTAPKPAMPEVLEAVAHTCERIAPELDRRRHALARCLDRLAAPMRKLVELYYDTSLTVAEVAERTGRSKGGLAVTMFRIRQKLADCTSSALEVEGA